jgi:hypothetical protein
MERGGKKDVRKKKKKKWVGKVNLGVGKKMAGNFLTWYPRQLDFKLDFKLDLDRMYSRNNTPLDPRLLRWIRS